MVWRPVIPTGCPRADREAVSLAGSQSYPGRTPTGRPPRDTRLKRLGGPARWIAN